MDPFFILPTILTIAMFTIFCGCVCVCCCFAKKQGRFQTVNRSGTDYGRVNRSQGIGANGSAYGANSSAFGANRTFGAGLPNAPITTVEGLNQDYGTPFGVGGATNQDGFGQSDNGGLNTNTYTWNTTHTVVNEMPPSYTEATGIPVSRHQNTNAGCDGFDSHDVKGSGRCDSDGNKSEGDKGGNNDSGGDSGDTGGGDTAGGDTGGGDTGGGDSGGGDTGGCDSGTTD